jgi:hypothetical protein
VHVSLKSVLQLRFPANVPEYVPDSVPASLLYQRFCAR